MLYSPIRCCFYPITFRDVIPLNLDFRIRFCCRFDPIVKIYIIHLIRNRGRAVLDRSVDNNPGGKQKKKMSRRASIFLFIFALPFAGRIGGIRAIFHRSGRRRCRKKHTARFIRSLVFPWRSYHRRKLGIGLRLRLEIVTRMIRKSA